MRRWTADYQKWECSTVFFCYPANRQLTLGCYVEDSEFPRPGESGGGRRWVVGQWWMDERSRETSS